MAHPVRRIEGRRIPRATEAAQDNSHKPHHPGTNPETRSSSWGNLDPRPVGAVVFAPLHIDSTGAKWIAHTSDQAESFPYIDFFPGIHAIIRRHQPSVDDISSLFVVAGFEQVAHEVLIHDMAPNWSSFVEKTKRRADSLLARLPDSDFEAGIRALDAYGGGLNQDRAVTVNVDLFVFRT